MHRVRGVDFVLCMLYLSALGDGWGWKGHGWCMECDCHFCMFTFSLWLVLAMVGVEGVSEDRGRISLCSSFIDRC